MIRILQSVNNMHRAGLETMLMNYYRHIDREQLQFDFLTHRPDPSDYDEEIRSLGGRIYYAPRLYPRNYPAYFSYMDQFWAEHPEYRIIHSHIDSMSYLPLKTAAKAAIPVRIAHSHNTALEKDFKLPLKLYFKYRLPSVATDFCACGQAAGDYLFPGRQVTIIPNAIESDRFRFHPDVRNRKRQELGLSKELVVGHVGRFAQQKNHVFILHTFHALLSQCPEAVLLLVGTGELENTIKQQAASLGLADHIRFLGSRRDVDELYQAMDVFFMPSLFEGLPVTGIEAQFSGLPCLFSDTITKETAFTDNCRFLSLKDSPQVWAGALAKAASLSERSQASVHSDVYEIRKSAAMLQNFYLSLWDSKK